MMVLETRPSFWEEGRDDWVLAVAVATAWLGAWAQHMRVALVKDARLDAVMVAHSAAYAVRALLLADLRGVQLGGVCMILVGCSIVDLG